MRLSQRHLAAGLLGLEAAFAEFVEQQLDMIALDLDDAVFQRPAGTAAALQRAGQFLEFAFRQGYAADGGHRLAASPLALATYPRDTVPLRHEVLLAHAAAQRLTAVGTMPTAVGGIDQPTQAGQGSGFLGHANLARESGPV